MAEQRVDMVDFETFGTELLAELRSVHSDASYPDSLTAEMRLHEDLALDSLDIVWISVFVEDLANIPILEPLDGNIPRTVGELHACYLELRGGGSSMNLADLLEPTASTTATIHFLSSGQRTAFGDLWHAGARMASAMPPGASGRTAMLLTPDPDCVTALLGIVGTRRDLVSLPLPARGMDPQAYFRQLRGLLRRVDCEHMFCDASLVALFEGSGLDVRAFGSDTTQGVGDIGRGDGGRIVQFTSGTTAQPRPIELESRAIAANISAILEVLDPAQWARAYSWLPLAHDMGLIGMFFTALVAGGPRWVGGGDLFLRRPEDFLAAPSRWIAELSEYAIDVTAAPPFALDVVSRSSRLLAPTDLGRLSTLIVGGDTIDARTLEQFAACFAPAGLRRRALCPSYGLAEVTLAATINPPAREWRTTRIEHHDAAGGRTVVGCGAPIPRVEIDAGHQTPAEILVLSPAAMRGDVGGPPRTPGAPIHTGDFGVLRDGELHVTGRAAARLVIGGRTMAAAAIEAAASRVPGVRPGGVAAVELNGEVALCVEHAAGTTVDAGALRRACLETIGVRVGRIDTVPRGQLPKTPSGKLQRWVVAELFAASSG